MKEQEGNITDKTQTAFLMLVLFALSLFSPARTFPFREYTTDDGLPQMETVGATQDSRGYIWISTRNGLAKFAGHTFTSFLSRIDTRQQQYIFIRGEKEFRCEISHDKIKQLMDHMKTRIVSEIKMFFTT